MLHLFCCLQNAFNLNLSKILLFGKELTNFDAALNLSRMHCGKRRNCLLRAISPFPTVFSKDLYCRHVKTMACLGKG